MSLRARPRLLVVDTETTGGNIFKHEILSYAFISYDDDEALEGYVSLIDEAEWTKYGKVEFDKYQDLWKRSSVDAARAVARIESFIAKKFNGEEAILAGHNIAFDRFFLEKLAFRAGVSHIKGVSHRTLDTHSLLLALSIKGKIPQGITSSDLAFKHFGIEVDPARRHTAVGDAVATKALLKKLLEEI